MEMDYLETKGEINIMDENLLPKALNMSNSLRTGTCFVSLLHILSSALAETPSTTHLHVWAQKGTRASRELTR